MGRAVSRGASEFARQTQVVHSLLTYVPGDGAARCAQAGAGSGCVCAAHWCESWQSPAAAGQDGHLLSGAWLWFEAGLPTCAEPADTLHGPWTLDNEAQLRPDHNSVQLHLACARHLLSQGPAASQMCTQLLSRRLFTKVVVTDCRNKVRQVHRGTVQPQAARPRHPRHEPTWGMTFSHVSMDTMLKPSCRAASTSGRVPWENQSVSSRRMSCRLLPLAARPVPRQNLLVL